MSQLKIAARLLTGEFLVWHNSVLGSRARFVTSFIAFIHSGYRREALKSEICQTYSVTSFEVSYNPYAYISKTFYGSNALSR